MRVPPDAQHVTRLARHPAPSLHRPLAALLAEALPLLEKEWQATVVQLLERLGWSVNHTRAGRGKKGVWTTPTTAKGWPDLVALRGARLLAIEVKGPKTPVTPEQLEWLARFAELPCACAWLLRPSVDAQALAEWIAYPEKAPRTFGFEAPAIRH